VRYRFHLETKFVTLQSFKTSIFYGIMGIGQRGKHNMFYGYGGEEDNVGNQGTLWSEAFSWSSGGSLRGYLEDDDIVGL
jgi:hypothetical protein